MILTAELLDNRIKACREYEKHNLGIKAGPDFADIARVLMSSKEFDSMSLSCALMGSIPFIFGRKDSSESDKDNMIKELAAGPKEPLAVMFYIGYRIGIAESESEQLERMAKK